MFSWSAVSIHLFGFSILFFITADAIEKEFTCLITEYTRKIYPNCGHNQAECGIQKCKKGYHMCHALYHNITGKLTPFYLGCWRETQPWDCTKNVCQLSPQTSHKLWICCCFGSNCNANVSKIIPTQSTPVTFTQSTKLTTAHNKEKKSLMYVVYVTFPLFGVFIVLSVGVFFANKHKKRRLQTESDNLILLVPEPVPLSLPIDLIEMLHEGQYSCVWKGVYQNKEVAVKILLAASNKCWEAEKTIYQQYHVKHKNILKFIGTQVREVGNNMQHCIITEYHSTGSLTEYLQNFTLDYNEFIKMLLDIVSGLRYLHTGAFESTTLHKTVIAHRDLKSCNILVKNDLTCCICDFGLAVVIPVDSSVLECKSQTQAGTKRYMAPEVLQGAIKFQTESFLCIDIYALALIMWELLSRCTATVVPGPYKLPYTDEVGHHPTIEDMQKCVADCYIRPAINPAWRQNKNLSAICETMQHCWDPEADARITVNCVSERMSLLTGEISDCDDDVIVPNNEYHILDDREQPKCVELTKDDSESGISISRSDSMT